MTESPTEMNIDHLLSAALRMPGAKPVFVEDLWRRISLPPEPCGAVPPRTIGRWIAVGVMILLLVVFLAAGPERVVAFIRGAIGFVPGVGLIGDTDSVLLLAEPVSLEQDGVAVTVLQAVADTDRVKMIVRLRLTGSRADPEWNCETGPDSMPVLHPTDGAGSVLHADYHLIQDASSCDVVGEFDPIPSKTASAVLTFPLAFLKVAYNSSTTVDLPLRFVTAGPATVLPVEIPSVDASASASGVEFRMDKVVGSDSTYLLFLSYRWNPQIHPDWFWISDSAWQVGNQPTGLDIRDANGDPIYFELYDDFPEINPEDLGGDGRTTWVFAIHAIHSPAPWTFSVRMLQVDVHPLDAWFQIDPGSYDEQGLRITQDRTDVDGHMTQLISARWLPPDESSAESVLELDLRTDPEILSVQLGNNPYSIRGGMVMPWDAEVPQGIIRNRLVYQLPLPKESLRIQISECLLVLKGDWQFTWQPPDAALQPASGLSLEKSGTAGPSSDDRNMPTPTPIP
jgi:hypothetical protein